MAVDELVHGAQVVDGDENAQYRDQRQGKKLDDFEDDIAID
jgi:hypothetical protein